MTALARVAVRPGSVTGVARLLLIGGTRVVTVCEEASCPNLPECWGRGTATFMVLGDICTRGCRYCAVGKGVPTAPDPAEPARLAAAAVAMRLAYVVMTMVDRDDLPDGGAAHIAACVRAQKALPDPPLVEVLVGDFRGDLKATETVLDAGVDVFAHNLDTVPRLYPALRPRGDYRGALSILALAAARGVVTKTSLIAGMGETEAEMVAAMAEAAGAGVRLFTCGQYLRPSARQMAVARHLDMAQFGRLEEVARSQGMVAVCGPLVRSSFRAESLYAQI
ncbi:MAG: lipoyl synthase [Proteobacteria bacterium]|nr:lipoyl synthase [Pseudomonadota bacterium]